MTPSAESGFLLIQANETKQRRPFLFTELYNKPNAETIDNWTGNPK
jgi:hypothetical protein